MSPLDLIAIVIGAAVVAVLFWQRTKAMNRDRIIKDRAVKPHRPARSVMSDEDYR